MRYWGYLAAKLLVVCAIAYGGIVLIAYDWPLDPAIHYGDSPFSRDLGYTFAMMMWFLFCMGLFYLAVLDTRYRCRTCVRRLRMPVLTGSWSHVLLGPSKMEYICPFGHGTLKVPEIQIAGPHPPDWEQHDDIWKELFSTEETKN